MQKSYKVPGVRANIAPWARIVVDKANLRRPSYRPKSYDYLYHIGNGNKAARRVIPLLYPQGEGVTCAWLQALPKSRLGVMRWRRDGQVVRRALYLQREDEKKKEVVLPGLFGSTDKNPVLVATVRGDSIRLDLHLGANDAESTDFSPPGLSAALRAAAMSCPTDNKAGYALALSDGVNSPLSVCLRLALDHACKTFGVVEKRDTPAPLEGPTAHPLQVVRFMKWA
jgi:hypothetical protein